MPTHIRRWLSLPALLITLAAPLQTAYGLGEKLIPADQAFRYSVSEDRGELVVRWTVEPGYYLYREKMSYASLTEGVTLDEPLYPRGATHEDEFFGEQEIYDTDFEVRVPYSNTGAERMTLELRSQGCADIGVCFPPQRWQAQVELASTAAAPAARAGQPVQHFTFSVRMHPDEAPRFGRPRRPADSDCRSEARGPTTSCRRTRRSRR